MTGCADGRNWIAYLTEALVSNGAMSTWEAAEYWTANLFGESPNPRLHEAKAPYEAIWQFLHRVYSPLVEAATRTIKMPDSAMIHVFTDISLIGHSAVLVVYFPGENRPHQLLLLDAVKAWDLVFDDAMTFNEWAEERYRWVVDALTAAVNQDGQQDGQKGQVENGQAQNGLGTDRDMLELPASADFALD